MADFVNSRSPLTTEVYLIYPLKRDCSDRTCKFCGHLLAEDEDMEAPVYRTLFLEKSKDTGLVMLAKGHEMASEYWILHTKTRNPSTSHPVFGIRL
ncbi:hypothetical protein D5086_004636, partial [Populus alba]